MLVSLNVAGIIVTTTTRGMITTANTCMPCCIPGTVVRNALHVLFYEIFSIPLRGQVQRFPHFTHEETEAQSG